MGGLSERLVGSWLFHNAALLENHRESLPFAQVYCDKVRRGSEVRRKWVRVSLRLNSARVRILRISIFKYVKVYLALRVLAANSWTNDDEKLSINLN